VLLLMDAFGVRPQIESMADRIASRGYVVLAPNLFYRAGREPVGTMADASDPDARSRLFQKLKPLMDELTPERLAADGDAYLARLEAEGDGSIAITGYCLGVRVGLRIASAHPDRVVAIGGFHGGGLVTADPDSPHLSLGSLRAQVYLGFADNDQSPQRLLEAAGEGRGGAGAGVRERLGVARRQARGDRDPDRCAELLAGVQQPGREPGLLL